MQSADADYPGGANQHSLLQARDTWRTKVRSCSCLLWVFPVSARDCKVGLLSAISGHSPVAQVDVAMATFLWEHTLQANHQ